MEMFEQDGGNLYRPHMMLVHSGRYWRCKHGITGFGSEFNWIGCAECKADDPEAYARFTGDNSKPDNASLSLHAETKE